MQQHDNKCVCSDIPCTMSTAYYDDDTHNEEQENEFGDMSVQENARFTKLQSHAETALLRIQVF